MKRKLGGNVGKEAKRARHESAAASSPVDAAIPAARASAFEGAKEEDLPAEFKDAAPNFALTCPLAKLFALFPEVQVHSKCYRLELFA